MREVIRSPHSVLRSALLPVLLLALLLSVPGCASTSGGGGEGGGDDLVGMVSSDGKISDRKISLRIAFDEVGSDIIDLREGETVSYDRLNSIYKITPTVSRETVGKIHVKVEVDQFSGNRIGHMELLPGEDKELSSEFGEDWPKVWVRVVRIVPPLRPGSLSDRSGVVQPIP